MVSLIILLVLLSPSQIRTPPTKELYIIWNVGQGLWTTWIQTESCTHFDSGGEFWPKDEIKKICQKKHNSVFLSHSDSDHMNGLRYLKSRNFKTCLMKNPREKIKSLQKRQLINSFDICSFDLTTLKEITELQWNLKSTKSNPNSRVIIFKNFLLPGDSPIKEEQKWLQSIKHLKLNTKIKNLLLGHHGSKSSTSDNLIKTLNLTMAIASARKQRYGHPHPHVVKTLKKRKVPLIETEVWGHLIFEI